MGHDDVVKCCVNNFQFILVVNYAGNIINTCYFWQFIYCINVTKFGIYDFNFSVIVYYLFISVCESTIIKDTSVFNIYQIIKSVFKYYIFKSNIGFYIKEVIIVKTVYPHIISNNCDIFCYIYSIFIFFIWIDVYIIQIYCSVIFSNFYCAFQKIKWICPSWIWSDDFTVFINDYYGIIIQFILWNKRIFLKNKSIRIQTA